MKFRTTASQHAQGDDIFVAENGIVEMPASVGAAFGLEPIAEKAAPEGKGKTEKAAPEGKK